MYIDRIKSSAAIFLLLAAFLGSIGLSGLSTANAAESVIFVQPTNAVPIPAPVDGSNYLLVDCPACTGASSPTGRNDTKGQSPVTTGLSPVLSSLYGYNFTTSKWDYLLLDSSDNLEVNCIAGCSGGSASNATSGVATSSTNGTTNAWIYGFNGTTWDQLQVDGSKFLKITIAAPIIAGSNIIGKVGIDQTTDGSTNAVTIKPTATAGAGITPVVSGAAESSHVLKGSAGNFYSAYITTGATAGFFMIDDAATAKSNGAITPMHCIQVAANSSASLSTRGGPPDVFATGITALFSTTGCFTLTLSATAFFSGSVK